MTGMRLTTPTISVLRALLAATDNTPTWGLAICRDADLGPGTVYPILARLQARGWATAWGETGAHPGRPRRVYYTLTEPGREQAAEALERRRSRMRREARQP